MPLSALTGTKLRDRRLAAGLRQAEVAVRAGISASYLNLIEHNRRKVTPEVMERLADALQIDRAALVEGREAALIDDLRTAAARGGAAAETAGGTGAEIERVEDFVDRFLGLYVNLNGFSQLEVWSRQRKEALGRWPARSGYGILL